MCFGPRPEKAFMRFFTRSSPQWEAGAEHGKHKGNEQDMGGKDVLVIIDAYNQVLSK